MLTKSHFKITVVLFVLTLLTCVANTKAKSKSGFRDSILSKESYCLVGEIKTENRLKDIAWSPDSNNLASANPKAIYIWDVKSRKVVTLLADPGVSDFESVAWNPDGKSIAALGNIVIVWDIATRLRIDVANGLLLGANGGTVNWNLDGSKLAFVALTNPRDGSDYRVQIWDRTTDKVKAIGKRVGNVPIAIWGPQDRLVLSDAIRLEIWNIQSDRLLINFKKGLIETWSIALSFDGTLLAGGNASYVYQLSTIQIWNVSPKIYLDRFVTLHGHTAGVVALSWKPNTKILASGSQDRTVRIWDAEKGQLLATLNGHHDTVNAVKWSPDGTMLASASEDGTILLWEKDSQCTF